MPVTEFKADSVSYPAVSGSRHAASAGPKSAKLGPRALSARLPLSRRQRNFNGRHAISQSCQERSFDHLIGAGDEGRGDVEADRGRGFEIDDQLEFGGQLDRQIGRPGAVEDAVDVTRRALEQDTEIDALGNEPA